MRYLFNDLYAYNDWANDKVLSLCEGLTDEQLDTPREMGFGTLRATLFHILTAEVVWMERWQSAAWREFPTDPGSMSVDEIADGLRTVSQQRSKLIDERSSDRWSPTIDYQDSTKTDYSHQLADLLLHVACHGVHHRAQALNYLKQFDRTVVAGIDYCFFRLAEHATRQTPEAVEGLTGYGLVVGTPTDKPCAWYEQTGNEKSGDATLVARLYQYNDWAVGRVLEFAADLSDEALDRDFNMGPGSIRKTLLHLFDAEQWWVENWTTGPGPFPQSAADTTIRDLAASWSVVAQQRNAFIATVDNAEAQRVVEILAGGPPTRFRVGESIVHLATHGVHHRAQLINMFRHVDAPWKNIDLLYGLADLPSET